MRIGVLALQGDFAEHAAVLRRIDQAPRAPAGLTGSRNGGRIEVVEVRLPGQLPSLHGLILPGGESTTIGKLLAGFGILDPLRDRIASGMPVFGTCAGAIVLARDIGGLDQPLIGSMDLRIRRNAYGRQLQSFETDLFIEEIGHPPLRAVFIRAPAIEAVGPGVEVLARLRDGAIVAARQENMLVTTFHPELSGDLRLHRYFLRMIENTKPGRARAELETAPGAEPGDAG